MMRENFYQFKGRGLGTGCHDDPYRLIQCGSGAVMVISYRCHGVEFVMGYCRKAMIDRWGVFCHDPFHRVSNSAHTRTWAEPYKNGLFIFRPTRLEVIEEKEWMRLRK